MPVFALTRNTLIILLTHRQHAVAAGPVFLSTNNVTTAHVRGIMAYHFLATNSGCRFSAKYQGIFCELFASQRLLFIQHLVNSSFAPHPGINGEMQLLPGPFVTDLKFTGLGTFPPGGAPYSGAPATATSLDNHAVNGVYYVIDKVLLPQ